MTWAALGQIVFQMHGAPRSVRARHGEDFAAHPIIGRKPVLQHTGIQLNQFSLGIFIHASFADPRAALINLEAAMAAHRALPFVLGDGTNLGRYVIRKIEVKPAPTFADGRLIAVALRVEIEEYVQQDTVTVVPIPATPPPAALQPGPGVQSFNPGIPAPLQSAAPPAGAIAPGLTPGLTITTAAGAPSTNAANVPVTAAVRDPLAGLL